jgi:hypothetical protein
MPIFFKDPKFVGHLPRIPFYPLAYHKISLRQYFSKIINMTYSIPTTKQLSADKPTTTTGTY